MQLRNYQIQDIERLRSAVREGSRCPLYVLPTGGGKTAVAAAMVRQAVDKGRHVIFLAPRRELIYQASHRLLSSDIHHGVIMAGERPSFTPQVQVACIPTLHARTQRGSQFRLPRADLVVVDEAHIGIGGMAQQIVHEYRMMGAVIIGLTATPARTDGKGLGAIYDTMVEGPTVKQLTEEGYLVPARYFAGEAPDLSEIKIQAGDYNQKELASCVDKTALIGDVVSNWARICPERQTFVFATSVAHSMHLAERFREIGVAAEHIDGKTSNDERAAIQQRLRDGKTQVICNCEVMTYGVDFPPVSAIVLAKPTKSIARFLQMVGRGLRTHPGKEDCMVLDHSGVLDDLGFPDDPMPWSLDGSSKIQERKSQPENKEVKSVQCGDCGATFRAAKFCPNCGKEMGKTYAKAVEAHEAELAEIRKGEKKKKGREWSIEEKAQFYAELKGHANIYGRKPKWADHTYRERLGVWPNDPRVKHVPAQSPSLETEAYIKHRNIKYAMSKKRKQQASQAA